MHEVSLNAIGGGITWLAMVVLVLDLRGCLQVVEYSIKKAKDVGNYGVVALPTPLLSWPHSSLTCYCKQGSSDPHSRQERTDSGLGEEGRQRKLYPHGLLLRLLLYASIPPNWLKQWALLAASRVYRTYPICRL